MDFILVRFAWSWALLVGAAGIGPATPSLSVTCSTTELRTPVYIRPGPDNECAIYGIFEETLIILPNFYNFDNREELYYYKLSL